MKFYQNLDAKDRRMLLIVLGLFVTLLVLLSVFTPSQDQDNNPTPDSHRTGRYGAKAAFTLLQQTGYPVERWEQPLADLAAQANAQTVLILAAPNTYENEEKTAVQTILQKGGRVLATDFAGGMLLPGNGVNQSKQVSFAACEADPEGLGPMAAPGSIWITPRSGWNLTDPRMRADYTCGGQPVVVEYPAEKGTAIWWASATPLENESIVRGHDLELLLNSVGPAAGHHLYWDESLHSPPRTQWDYVSGPVWPLLWSGCLGMALLVLLSFSRRRGPVRALPTPPRTTPIEFLDALGGLYRSTGATNTAVQIAWERFRTQAIRLTGLNGLNGKVNAEFDATQIAAALEKRFGTLALSMQYDLAAAQEATWNDRLKPRHALKLVQSLRRHEETLRAASNRSASATRPAEVLR